MKILGVDQTNCIKCKICIQACPATLFYIQEEKGDPIIRFENPHGWCIECGHCLSVCPVNAIEYEDAEVPYEFKGADDPSSILDYDDLMKVLRSRRSIHRFKEQTIPKEHIKAILDAMRYAPSMHNMQSWEYIVLMNKERIHQLRLETLRLIKGFRRLFRFGVLFKHFMPEKLNELISAPGTKLALDAMIEQCEKGEDPIFHSASAVIIAHAPALEPSIFMEAGIVMTHGMLAAQSLGLGSCLMGWAQEALRKYKKNKKWLNVPKDHDVYGVMVVGYPDLKFLRTPPRNPVKMQWDIQYEQTQKSHYT